jgi:hypothetical protein
MVQKNAKAKTTQQKEKTNKRKDRHRKKEENRAYPEERVKVTGRDSKNWGY